MASTIKVRIVGDNKSLVNAFRGSSSAARRWNSDLVRAGRGAVVASVGFRGIGRSIAFASGAFVGGAGLTAALKASIQGFSSFQEEMQRAVGLGNVAQKSIGRFSKEVLALSTQVGKSPQELAHAFYIVASSGIAASKSMGVVTQAAKLSVAGLGDTATVVDAITSALNAYGPANLSAAKAADVLAATVRLGKGEASQFAPVIGNVVALASKLGVSFDQVGAALAAQTRLGTDAETTAIQLQRVFGTLIKITPKSAKAFASVGLNADKLREQLGTRNGLIKVLLEVRKAFGNNDKALAAAFGDIRALRGILNLVGKQAGQTTAVFNDLAHSTGSAKKAFDAIDKTTAQQFRKLKASVQVLGISLGAIFAPLAAKLAGSLAVVANNFTKFVDKVNAAKGFSAKFEVVTTGIKGLSLRVGRELLQEFNKIDFHQLGHVVGQGIASSLEDIVRAIRRVDWGQVGKVIADDISAFVARVNWGRIFVDVFITVPAAVANAVGNLFLGLGKELMKRIGEGIQVGAKKALLFIEKWALDVVIKVLGAFGFLGRFDPFKGLENKAKAKLQAVQAAIDKLHGKNIEIKILTKAEQEHGGFGDSGVVPFGEKKKKRPTPRQTPLDLSGGGGGGLDPKALKDKIQKALDAITNKFDVAFKRAQLTASLDDDLKVLVQEKAALEKLHAAHKGNLKIESALLDVVQQIQQATKDQFQRQLDFLDIALSKAQMTPQLNDDLKILDRQRSLLERQVKLHKDDLDLRQKLVAVQGQVNQINQQAISDARSLLGSPFTIPEGSAGTPITFLGGSRGKNTLFGGQDAQGVLRTITQQNKVFARQAEDIATLQKRGAPAQLIREALSGQITPEILDTLAHANKSTLDQIFKQFRRQEKLVARVAKMEVSAPSVSVKAQRLAVAGLRASSPGGPLGTGRGKGGETVVYVPVYLDGKKIAESTARASKRRSNQRRGRASSR